MNPSSLFNRLTRPLKITASPLPESDEINRAQLQMLMMAEVLRTPTGTLDAESVVCFYLDATRQHHVTAAVALFPAWLFATNECAFFALSADELAQLVTNCEAMLAGDKFFYDDSCGIDAGAGVARSVRELFANCIEFNFLQGAEFTAEDWNRFIDAGAFPRERYEALANAD